MRQSQYIYTTEDEFIGTLAAFREEAQSINANCTLIRILSADTDKDLLSNICSDIDREFPEALYIGCTTNANIIGGQFNESGICITFSMFTSPDTHIDIMQKNISEYSSQKVMAEIPRFKELYPGVKAIEVLVSSNVMMGSHLTRAFENNSCCGITIYGGGAYTGEVGADSFVFAKGYKPDSRSIVLAFFSGDDLHIEARRISGWKPLGHDFAVTSAKGNVLYTLDNKPAFDIYSRYLNILNDENFENNAIEFPFMCTTNDGRSITRTPISSNPDGSIVIFSEIDTFPSVRLSYGDKNYISTCIENEAKRLNEFRPESIMLFSCVARRAFWAQDVERESSIFQSVAPTSGFYTSGEILTENDRLYHHNETLLIVGVREGDIDTDAELPELPLRDREATISFASRFAKFISVANQELEESNKELDKMIREVEESRFQAEAANRAKSDFLANMSHEIRTPINAILGFDTMILRESTDDDIIKYASDIMHAGTNLLSIINDILDLSKIESGKMTIVNVEYELSSVILDVVNMMSMKAGEKGLKVNVEVDRDIPAWLFGDDVRIRQIIINLMNNAVKYTESGSITLIIHGTRRADIETLHVEIKDTGIGIKEEDIDKLYEKFTRIEEDRNHNIEGTGLGMNITISLLAMMNSRLKVTSEYGSGSSFSFKLDQKVLRDEPIGNIDERSTNRTDETDYTSSFTAPCANVLVVDDNEMNRQVVIALLKKTGIKFDQADGGFRCLEMTKDFKYDLILLDHMMPDLDGVTTLHRIKADDNNKNQMTPVVCMTANAISGAKEEYIEEGFDAYMSKPFMPKKLEKLLAELLPQELVLTAHELVPSLQKEDDETASTHLPVIDGIDNDTAMANLVTEKLVIDTMNVFMGSAAAEARYLKNCYDIITDDSSTDTEIGKAVANYRVKVHAMKSSSLTIGAVMVSNIAKFLEYSARDNNLFNIKNVTVSFLNEWAALVSRMKEAFGIEDIPSVQQDAPSDISPEKLSSLLTDLNDKINEMDIDSADAIVKQLEEEGLRRLYHDDFECLRQAVINIDLDQVADLTGRFIELLKN